MGPQCIGCLTQIYVPIIIEKFGNSYSGEVTFTDLLGCIFTQESIPVHITPFEANLPGIGPSGCAPLTVSLLDSVSVRWVYPSWEWSIGNPTLLYLKFKHPEFYPARYRQI